MSVADATTWMRRALDLAGRGRGWVEPNPLVGAVVVRGEEIAGEGWHQRFGEAHAEVHALAAAGEKASGATLYVTLEPCCHHGKTPPCTEAVLRSGVSRVVVAMRDPFPLVAGQGIDLLREKGVQVDVGVCEEEAQRLNAPFIKLVTTGRPYVHLKWAMTLDGKIATRTGDSKWISGEASRRRVHQLRGMMDGILVGVGTALADDPQLTARPPGPRLATRVVLDSQCRLPLTSHLVQHAREVPTLVITTPAADAGAVAALEERGCEVLRVGAKGERCSVSALLDELGKRRWTNLLVEGGSGILGAFLDEQVADEVHVFIAPKLVGGAGALTPAGGVGADSIVNALSLDDFTVETTDRDLYLRGTVMKKASPRG